MENSSNNHAEPDALATVLKPIGRALSLYRWEVAPLAAASGSYIVLDAAAFSHLLATALALLVAGLIARAWWSPQAFKRHGAQRQLMRMLYGWPILSEHLGLAPVRNGEPQHPKPLSSDLIAPGCMRLVVRIPSGLSLTDFKRQAEALGAGFGASSCSVSGDPRRANEAILDLIGTSNSLFDGTDPKTVLSELKPGLPVGTPVLMGQLATAEPLRVPLLGNHWLLSGQSGGGKSVAVQSLCAHLALSDMTALWLIDPKRTELTYWRDVAARLETDNTEAIEQMLRDLIAEMEKRFTYMEENTLRTLEPSATFPHIVLVLEEIASLTASEDTKKNKQFIALLMQLAQKARASSISLCLITQYPKSTVLDSSIVNLMGTRFAFRASGETMSNVCLGDDVAKEYGISASRIGNEHKGMFYIAGEAQAPRLARSFWITDEQLKAIAKTAKAFRGVLPPFEAPNATDLLDEADATPQRSNASPFKEIAGGLSGLSEPLPQVIGDALDAWAEAGGVAADSFPPPPGEAEVLSGCPTHIHTRGRDAIARAMACPRCGAYWHLEDLSEPLPPEEAA
jgi:S-DNA-T family DNA segregation ATPase FtsK/SpoIIIE